MSVSAKSSAVVLVGHLDDVVAEVGPDWLADLTHRQPRNGRLELGHELSGGRVVPAQVAAIVA